MFRFGFEFVFDSQCFTLENDFRYVIARNFMKGLRKSIYIHDQFVRPLIYVHFCLVMPTDDLICFLVDKTVSRCKFDSKLIL